MYNYSLMNNASRLLLISHTRPTAATEVDGTNTCMYIHTLTYSTYILVHINREDGNDVTGV